MDITSKTKVCEAYVVADTIYTKEGQQLFFLDGCSGIYVKETDLQYKKYPKSKKVYFSNGVECKSTFDSAEEWQEWKEFLYNEVQEIG